MKQPKPEGSHEVSIARRRLELPPVILVVFGHSADAEANFGVDINRWHPDPENGHQCTDQSCCGRRQPRTGSCNS